MKSPARIIFLILTGLLPFPKQAVIYFFLLIFNDFYFNCFQSFAHTGSTC